MATELMPQHVTSNAILPGYVETPMTSSGPSDLLARSHPTGRMSGPVDIAGIALLYAGAAGAHLTGTLTPVDGGMALSKPEARGKEIGDAFKPQRGPDGKAKL